MERSWVSNRDRATAVVAVALVHAALFSALLTLGAGRAIVAQIDPLKVFDVTPDPPPPPPPPPITVETKKAPKPEGASAPPAKKAEATPIVKPPPRVVLPVTPPVVAAPKPGTGAAPSQGAAPVDGPGTGAGGTGNGTGSGGSGSGPGGGGGGGGTGPSVIASTTLTGRSYPRDVLRAWPRGARVFVAVRVQVDGRATDCKVNRSSGDAIVDQWTCRLVEERVRFRPAIDGNGRPYVRWYGYVQAPVNF